MVGEKMTEKRCPKCSDELKVKGNHLICKSALKNQCDYILDKSTEKVMIQFNAQLVRVKAAFWMVRSEFGSIEVGPDANSYLEMYYEHKLRSSRDKL